MVLLRSFTRLLNVDPPIELSVGPLGTLVAQEACMTVTYVCTVKLE